MRLVSFRDMTAGSNDPNWSDACSHRRGLYRRPDAQPAHAADDPAVAGEPLATVPAAWVTAGLAARVRSVLRPAFLKIARQQFQQSVRSTIRAVLPRFSWESCVVDQLEKGLPAGAPPFSCPQMRKPNDFTRLRRSFDAYDLRSPSASSSNRTRRNWPGPATSGSGVRGPT